MQKKRIETLLVYIPESLDIDDLLKNNPLDIPNAKDYIAFLLFEINRVPAYHKDEYLDNQGYTILYSKILKLKVENYAIILNYLCDNGIIESNNSYSTKNKKSKGYRFTKEYSVKVKPYKITLRTLVKRIFKNVRLKDKIPDLRAKDLLGFNKSVGIDPNSSYRDVAISKLSKLKTHQANLSFNKQQVESFLSRKLIHDHAQNEMRPIDRYNRALLVVNGFENGNERFTVDDTSGRLHTMLTSLKSELRGTLTHNIKNLSSADIKNSQPLLSLVFLDEQLLLKNNMLQRIAIYNKNFQNWEDENNLFSHSIMLRDLIKNSAEKEDVKLYRELVISGEIYDFFGNQLLICGLLINQPLGQIRKLAKKEIFRILFDRNQAVSYADSKGLRLFRELFPNVYNIFSRIKSGSHRALACSLQNLEAEIILHKVCEEIDERMPELPLFTIHDSIATYSDSIEIVKEILVRHLEKVVGAEPQIKIEHWNESMLAIDESPIKNANVEYQNLYRFVSDEPELPEVKYYSLALAAKKLGIKPRKFNDILRDRGILKFQYSSSGKFNVPNELYLEEEYFHVVERHFRHVRILTTKVTEKGLEFLKVLLVEQNR